mgnify:CR=1 FL=1
MSALIGKKLGMTQVYNDKEDIEIRQVAEQGTQNILDVMSNNCKIVLIRHIHYRQFTTN